MAWPVIFEISVVVFLGSILQGAVGFGIGLFSIPILIWIGVPVAHTVAIIVTASGLQTAWSWYQTREHMSWAEPVPITMIRLLAMPAGIITLGILSAQNQSDIKKAVGAVILLILIAQWLFKIKPRQRLATGWMWLAGLISGYLTGLISMGGPPLVMWVMAHDWPNNRSRAFLWLSFLIATPPMLGLLLWRFGHPLIGPMILGALLIPVIVAGSLLGLAFGKMMNRSHLRIAMTALLVIIAATSIAGI